MQPAKKKSLLLEVRLKKLSHNLIKSISMNQNLTECNNKPSKWIPLTNYKCKFYMKNKNKLDKLDKSKIKSNNFC